MTLDLLKENQGVYFMKEQRQETCKSLFYDIEKLNDRGSWESLGIFCLGRCIGIII